MYPVMLNQNFSYAPKHPMNEEEFAENDFEYELELETELDFVPQIGSSINVRGINTAVQTLNFNVDDASINIGQTLELPDEETAIIWVKKLMGSGWELIYKS